jgi:hypothetical protein
MVVFLAIMELIDKEREAADKVPPGGQSTECDRPAGAEISTARSMAG